ncbi:unnamed protein product [Ascophyllum nodosum]
MGICSSGFAEEPTWEERWSTPACKTTLKELSSKEMNEKPDGDQKDYGKVLRGIKEEGQFRNWAATVQTAPARVLKPANVLQVQKILQEARGQNPMPKIRCVGSGHSWSPLFADDGAWLIDTSDMKDIKWNAGENSTQVTIGPGVTTGDLAKYMDSRARGKWRSHFLSSDVVLEDVTYGGTINTACHGTGKTQTLPDYVVSTRIVKWDGTVVKLIRADDPEGFKVNVLHFGLLGVTVDFTLQLDKDNHAISVTDSKVRAEDLFLGRGQLPAAGGPNPLLELWNTTFGIEIFYFAASSLEITNVLSREFEDQDWNTDNDICAVKIFKRTNNLVGKDNDSCFGADNKTSTRFDHSFSITDFIKINLGTEVALPLVAKIGSRPALVALYSKIAAKAFEPVGKETGEVSYETSLAQAIHWQKYITDGFPVSDTEVCIKCDPDFTSAYKAIHAAIDITKRFAEDEDSLPLNVAMEMRFTKHSYSPLSPAYGKEGDVFIWIEVLSAVTTPLLKPYCTAITDAWLAITLKDGTQAALPHWAKWSEAYVADADKKLKEAFKERLPLLQAAAKEFDPNGIFMNDFFTKLFLP